MENYKPFQNSLQAVFCALFNQLHAQCLVCTTTRYVW